MFLFAGVFLSRIGGQSFLDPGGLGLRHGDIFSGIWRRGQCYGLSVGVDYWRMWASCLLRGRILLIVADLRWVFLLTVPDVQIIGLSSSGYTFGPRFCCGPDSVPAELPCREGSCGKEGQDDER